MENPIHNKIQNQIMADAYLLIEKNKKQKNCLLIN